MVTLLNDILILILQIQFNDNSIYNRQHHYSDTCQYSDICQYSDKCHYTNVIYYSYFTSHLNEVLVN